MINTLDFSKRLQKVIEFYDETASSFAEKIGVQRSSISHILSGRNKPSLDFVMKVLHSYPEVELYWLMNGKGEFPKPQEKEQKPIQPQLSLNEIAQTASKSSEIEKIIIFYKNGSFKSYEN
ncbi:helix-turn-helix domain-containing protein [Winogradskyella immobilis]|uniref:Helix-turn-helix transcriptional regulator n=1 Tax=Winogradskyella immobilis TaxID=2816852 RepID=A0ABS8EQ23_9FLAO|nr:helix-turn-helix transcriptional regulator [Winogradskyella immobilis]MCC1485324.1 helix-turn-helix transcriptional regulator [Winogradskyella immobilis]MCG0017416.1 helix-turn-helix domain-containing protein [Winogradskyella immobilis]